MSIEATVFRYPLVSITLFILLLGTSHVIGQQSTAEYEAVLRGSNEVPANTSLGFGTITAVLDGDQLAISGDFSNLQSHVATQLNGGAHLHVGFTGENGPVVFPLKVNFGIVPTGGFLLSAENTFTLEANQIEALKNRRMYVNIHSMDFQGGEIRGQLVPKSAQLFRASFSGRAEVSPAIANRSLGVGSALLELREDSLIVSGAFAQLESDLVTENDGGVHLYAGNLDTNGTVVFPLVVTPGDDKRSGRLDPERNQFKLSPSQIELMHEKGLYINIHTEDLPAGELRGQIVSDSAVVMEAFLAPENQVELNILTQGSGGVIAILDGNELSVGGSFINLADELATDLRGGSHIHNAIVTEDGDIEVDLSASLSSDKRNGIYKAADHVFELDDNQRLSLLNGMLYVNVHSLAYLGGEIRGQLLASTNLPPPPSAIILPEDGSTIVVPASLAGSVDAEWEVSVDPNGNTVVYIWEIAFNPNFSGQIVNVPLFTTTESVPYLLLQGLVEQLGLEIGPQGLLLYHRIITTDGSLRTVGETGSILLTRESLSVGHDSPLNIIESTEVFPNPTQNQATLQFDLSVPAIVTVELYNPLGIAVQKPVPHLTGPGKNNVLHLDFPDAEPGVYMYRLTAVTNSESHVRTGKITVVK